MEAVVLFSALIIGYLLLRSRGGEGLNVRFDLGSISTSKGKKNRAALAIALAVWSSALVFVFARQQGDECNSVVLASAAGALMVLIFFFKDRFKR
jgi:hypothetical protein